MPIPDLRVTPAKPVRLADIDPRSTPGFKAGKNGDAKAKAEALLVENRAKLLTLQYRLWAENTRSILLILQGMDTSGKDGVVRHVIAGMNPEGVRVVSFKKPSEIELDHDFLWRIHKECPGKGEIRVFNRSHYEDVLVVRVHNLVPEKTWRARYDLINAFEKSLAASGTVVVKCFLHISKEEQKERLLARLADPEKNWKFNPSDVAERAKWDDYQRAYEDALSKCSTPESPWHIVPADRKWYRNAAISQILVGTLETLDPKPPKGTFKPSDFKF
jgi:PPK2 family polyphosphate:nucleotide phosphotransferase